jgi:hypothetical protein
MAQADSITGEDIKSAIESALLPSLSSGNNVIGNVGINGTLPDFTSPPTFKIDQSIPGTTNKVSIGSDGTVGINGSVAVTGAFYQPTQPVSLATLPPLSTGSNAIGSITNTAFGSTQSGTWNINNISGSISLPALAATSTLQTSGNASLTSIDNKTPALGQAIASASVPVVLTTAQLTTITPLSTITANLGTIGTAATSAKQDTGNTSLGSIDATLLSVLLSGRLKVTLPSTQRTPTLAIATGAGTISAGKTSVTVANVGVANGVLLGVSISQGAYGWDAPVGDTIGPLVYDATGTTFLISTLS